MDAHEDVENCLMTIAASRGPGTPPYEKACERLISLGKPAAVYFVDVMGGRTDFFKRRFPGGIKDYGQVQSIELALFRLAEANGLDFIDAVVNSGCERTQAIIGAIGLAEDPRVDGLLIEAFRSPFYTTRFAPAESLFRRRSVRALDVFLAALNDRDLSVKMVGIKAVKEFGDERAVEPLRRVIATAPKTLSSGLIKAAS